MSLPVAGGIPMAVAASSMSSMELFAQTINTNPIFIGVMMIMMNLGARFLSFELSKKQEAILQHPYFRRFLIFVVIFIGTRNIITAFWLSLLIILCIGYLFNENSALCIWRGGVSGATCAAPQKEGFAAGAGLSPEERNILNMLRDKETKAARVPVESDAGDKKEENPVEKYNKNMQKVKSTGQSAL